MANGSKAGTKATGQQKPVSWRSGCIVGGVVLVSAIYLVMQSEPSAPTPSAMTQPAKPKTVSLASLDQQAQPIALQPLASKYDPEGYRKLGKGAWNRSNELRRWVALAALQSDSCSMVQTVAVWEKATRSDLRWHVGCGNGERFVISEAQARNAKARFDPKALSEEKKRYGAETTIAQPMSAVWANFNEDGAVRACESILGTAAVNKNSLDFSGLPTVQRDDESSEAQIDRDFSSENAMGGTISAKYQCVVDASGGGRVLTLKTLDAFGVHTIFQ